MPMPTRSTAKVGVDTTELGPAAATAIIQPPVLPLRPLSKRKTPNNQADIAAITPVCPGSKTSRPQGTSPMAMVNGDNMTSENSLAVDMDMTIDVDSTAKSDPKESDKDSQGVDSLSNLISSARKTLFQSTSGSGDKQTVTTTRSRKWVPIKKTGDAQDDSRVSSSAPKAASFVEGRNFNLRDASLAKRPPQRILPARGTSVWSRCI
jgi:hypothetical protein